MKNFDVKFYDDCKAFVDTFLSVDKEYLKLSSVTQHFVESYCVDILCCFLITYFKKMVN